MLTRLAVRCIWRWSVWSLASFLVLPLSAQAEEKNADQMAVETAIRATADLFAKAFNAGNAKAVAALWTEQGTLTDERGQILKGRQAIEDQYAAFFKAYPTATITVTVLSMEFPTPTTAVEDGVSQVSIQGVALPTMGRYTALHVRQGDAWLMAMVRESGTALPSNASRLESLDWLVGQWETKQAGTTVRAHFHWVANRSFLQRDDSVTKDGVSVASGIQIIGWDPRAERIRSWSFDASGGYGTGLWSTTADGWTIETVGMLANGMPTTSLDRWIRVPGEDRVLGWQSLQRRVGDSSLPDTREVVLDRVPAKP